MQEPTDPTLVGWPPICVTRAGKMLLSQLIHSRDDTDTKHYRYRTRRWSNVFLRVDDSAYEATQQNHKRDADKPRPPPRSDHPWYLWDTLLSFLFLGHTNQTKQKSQEHNLHLVSLVDFLLSRLRVSQWLERMGILPLFIASLCCCDPSWTNGCPC